MLAYRYDPKVIRIKESANGNDVEFLIQIFEETYAEAMKKIKKRFEDNRVYTDVLFYVHANHEYQVIVRRDFYVDFVLSLMRHRLLQRVEWTS